MVPFRSNSTPGRASSFKASFTLEPQPPGHAIPEMARLTGVVPEVAASDVPEADSVVEVAAGVSAGFSDTAGSPQPRLATPTVTMQATASKRSSRM